MIDLEILEARLSPEPNTGCMLWTGSTSGDGYGRVWFDGKAHQVTRTIWELKRGPIPPGMQVCHTCDNPPCGNDRHFFLGTNRDNHIDSIRKGRAPCFRGADNGKSKLTTEQAEEIRRRAIPGMNRHHPGNFAALAAEFKVDRSVVTRIAKGTTYGRRAVRG